MAVRDTSDLILGRKDPADHRTYRKERMGFVAGLLLPTGIGGISFVFISLTGLSSVSPMVLAALIGMIVGNLLRMPASFGPGLSLASRWLLRAAIVLLGFKITLWEIYQVGFGLLGAAAFVLLATFLFTQWAGRLLKVDKGLATLIASGTSICGASAIVAANTVVRCKDEDVTYALACVTFLGTISLFLYPFLASAMDLTPNHFGFWAGASIHEVGQAVAAGFQVGPEAGESATMVKLFRVLMLAPTMFCLAGWTRLGERAVTAPQAHVTVPWFILLFIIIAIVNSFIAIPFGLDQIAGNASGLLFAVALAAMGLDTRLSRLMDKKLRPFTLAALAWLFISLISLAVLAAVA